jgi:orotidine-5'-phosphate decarboxylase
MTNSRVIVALDFPAADAALAFAASQAQASMKTRGIVGFEEPWR